MIQKHIGDLCFPLREDFDFAFLAAWGEPFAVFDQQDSGNICFGLRRGEGRLFVKIAGPATVRANVEPPEAIERIRGTLPVYRDLAHPLLSNLLEDHEIPGGHMLVFDWFDGVCMGKQYGKTQRFFELPWADRLRIFEQVLDFHCDVAQRGYVAVDFYEACILYDFETKDLRLCDIEMYHKGAFENPMERLWGSGRFMSPEEFQKGAVIDEVSNVFAMGGAAFVLLGGGLDRSPDLWAGPAALHGVAKRAVSPEREGRYQSLAQLREAWRAARRDAGMVP